jgi:signal transduction histidine kinase
MTKVIGALNLYSSTSNFFTRPEIELLEKIVSSISFAIDSIDANEKRELAERNLKSALAIRDEFLSIASHELKTPLTSMKLQLQMLQRGMNLHKDDLTHELKINKSLTLSINQVQRMNSLVESLLDVSRIQAGKLDFHFEQFDASEVLENSLDSFNYLISESGCDFSKSIEKSVICFLDRGRIEQVFINLISNALKYARGCRVNICLSKEIDSLIFKIHDDGPGIPLDKQPEVFDRFQRGSASSSFGGLGLGLFITKQIVDSHGGEIKLESRPGLGTSFIVRLPLQLSQTA